MQAVASSPSTDKVVPQRSARRPLLIVGIVAAVLAAGYVTYSVVTSGTESTDDAEVVADLVPVSARASGQVVRVAIEENQPVKVGDLLIELDSADYAARVRQAEAELEVARAQATGAEAQVHVVEATSKGGLASAKAAMNGSSVGVGTAEAQSAAARAGLLRAEAELKKAEMDLSRNKELRAQSATTQERLDNAQLIFEATQAGLAQAKAQVAMADEARRLATTRVDEAQGRLNQSSPIDAQIATARASADLAHARVDSALATLELAKLQLSYTKIVAPTDGIASKLSVHLGQLVTLGQPVIQLVTPTTYVIANFKETQIGRMKLGQEAEIEVDAYPGKKLHGKVNSLAGGTGASFSILPPDNASGNFVKVVQRVPVRIEWQERPTNIELLSGLSAEVTVRVQ